MEYKIDYKVVVGDKHCFEKEMNELSKQGYLCYGNMNTNVTQGGVFYSQLMGKTEPLNK